MELDRMEMEPHDPIHQSQSESVMAYLSYVKPMQVTAAIHTRVCLFRSIDRFHIAFVAPSPYAIITFLVRHM